jgi:biopolymer transport protein ExbD
MAVKIDKGSVQDLNLTPMIDLVFNLLIFFMVTTEFAKEENELAVVLPAASAAMPLTAKPKEIFVNVTDKGEFFMLNKRVSEEEIETYLIRAARNNPVQQKVIIRADKRVPFASVVKVMDLCNKADIKDYTVTTEANE